MKVLPVNDQRVVQIILENVGQIENRYDGYLDDMRHLVANVMVLEMEHQIQKTNIKQLIAEKVALTASDLYEKTK